MTEMVKSVKSSNVSNILNMVNVAVIDIKDEKSCGIGWDLNPQPGGMWPTIVATLATAASGKYDC